MRVIVLLSSLALALAAGAQATPGRGTLTGLVTRGPITPVCTVEQPCDEPAAHVTLVFSHADRDVARVTTGADGRYRVRLPAMTYQVRRARSGALDRKLEPHTVLVKAGRTLRIDFSIDTGIR
jgi:Carboxypeptidase regulatory-like domain